MYIVIDLFFFGVVYGLFSCFLFLLYFDFAFVYSEACKLVSKQLNRQLNEPQNEQPISS